MRSIDSIKGYVYLGVSVLVLAAAVLFVLLQWGNHAQISVYGKNVENANTLLLIACSAAGGLLLQAMVRLLRHSVRLLRSSGPPTP